MGLIFNGNGDVIKAVDGSLTVEGLDIGGSTNIEAGIGTFSGNLNVGGVLTYEDVKNVDSVGIVTARDHINIVTDSKKLQLGAGQDLTLHHDGSNSVIQNITGNLYLNPNNTQSGITLIGSTGAVTLFHGGNLKFETESTGAKVTGDLNVTGNIDVADNVRIKLGTGDDMQIWHDGSTTKFSDSGPVLFYSTSFTVQSPSAENIIIGTQNGAVELYFNNSKKLETTNAGIGLNDNVKAGFGNGGDLNIYHSGSHSYIKHSGTGNLYTDIGSGDQYSITTAESAHLADFVAGGAVTLRFNGNAKFETTNTGVKIDNASTTEMILLDVAGTNFAKIGHNSSSGVAVLDVRSEGHTRFLTGGNNERLRITSGGQLLLGTTSVSNAENFRIHTASSDKSIMKFTNTGTGTAAGDGLEFGLNSNEHAELVLKEDKDIIFYSGATTTEKLRITSTGLMGLGTGSPSDALEISHASDPAIRLHYGSNSGYSVISIDNANNLTLDVDVPSAGSNSFFNVKIDGSEKFRIDSSGRVLIGTTSADDTSQKLKLYQAGNDHCLLNLTVSSSTYSSLINFGDGGSFGIGQIAYAHSDDSLRFRVNASERLRITSAGNVGINKTSPGASLHIGGPSEIRLDNASDAGNWAKIRCFEESGNNHAILAFNVGSGEALRIANNGNIGINETSPDRALHVKTTTDTEQIYVENTASSGRAQVRFVNPHGDWVTGLIGGTTEGDFITYTSAAKNFRVYTNAAERLRIKSTGEVLIGHTAVIGHNGVDGYLQVTGTGTDDSSINLNRFSNDNWCPFITFGKSRNASKGGNTVVQNGDYIGYINFCANDGTDFNNNAAAIYCKVGGDPGTDDTPGALYFTTCPDNTNAAVVRQQILANGVTQFTTTGSYDTYTTAENAYQFRHDFTNVAGVWISNTNTSHTKELLRLDSARGGSSSFYLFNLTTGNLSDDQFLSVSYTHLTLPTKA